MTHEVRIELKPCDGGKENTRPYWVKLFVLGVRRVTAASPLSMNAAAAWLIPLRKNVGFFPQRCYWHAHNISWSCDSTCLNVSVWQHRTEQLTLSSVKQVSANRMDSVKLLKLIGSEKSGESKTGWECSSLVPPTPPPTGQPVTCAAGLPHHFQGTQRAKDQSRPSPRQETNRWFVSRKKRFSQRTQRFLCRKNVIFGAFLIIPGLFLHWATLWCRHFWRSFVFCAFSPSRHLDLKTFPPVFLVTYLSPQVLLLVFLQVKSSASRDTRRCRLEGEGYVPVCQTARGWESHVLTCF